MFFPINKNRESTIKAVIQALNAILFLSSRVYPAVMLKKKGAPPTGSIITKRAIKLFIKKL